MHAELRVEVRDGSGRVVAVRRAQNSVMRNGASLVADLFAGRGSTITHMGLGSSDAPETEAYNTEELSGEELGDLAPIEAAIPPEAFSPAEIDDVRRVVRLRVRATVQAGIIPEESPLETISMREAGLISREGETAILYNRVTFAPIIISKGDDHELTMFWEVNFPYGDI